MSKDRPKRIALIARESASLCEELQRFHADKAIEYGYSKDLLTNMSDDIAGIKDSPYLDGAEESIIRFRNFLAIKEKDIEKTNIASLAYTIGTSASTATALGEYSHTSPIWSFKSIKEPPSWDLERIEKYADRLDHIDPILGKLLRSVWDSFYGGVGEYLRSSLLSMRQLYDHFFEIIAPDEEVRNSEFFSLKEGKQCNKVYRIEKMRYAARTKVRDKELGSVLETQAEYLLKLYKELNRLHSRNNLMKDVIRDNLMALQALLEQWIDGLKR